MEKICQLCGTHFDCGAPGLCWCAGRQVSQEKRLLLAAVSSDCVCRDCLEG